MVGVELRATWTQTRKANGDAVQGRVTRKTKGGKFMPLNMRSWSANTFCLSQVWFKTPVSYTHLTLPTKRIV